MSLHILQTGPCFFSDRYDAGRQLGEALQKIVNSEEDVIVIGIPRGGLLVAAEIARLLDAALDFITPRKLGAPGNPELAIGALTERGHIVLNEEAITYLNVPREYIEAEAERQLAEIRRRNARYRAILPHRPLGGRTLILTDDGVATGSTMRAAILSARAEQPARLILALPVAPYETLLELAALCDDTLALCAPSTFLGGVGAYYQDFHQVPDSEVEIILRAHALRT